MPKKILPVRLSESEQQTLQAIVNQGHQSARQIKRAQILLHSHGGKPTEEIAAWVGTSLSTVYNTRAKYQREGLQGALQEKPRPGQPRKLDSRQEAAITVLACSDAPAGHARWTVRLLTDEIVKTEIVDSIGRETVRQFLKKTCSSPG